MEPEREFAGGVPLRTSATASEREVANVRFGGSDCSCGCAEDDEPTRPGCSPTGFGALALLVVATTGAVLLFTAIHLAEKLTAKRASENEI